MMTCDFKKSLRISSEHRDKLRKIFPPGTCVIALSGMQHPLVEFGIVISVEFTYADGDIYRILHRYPSGIMLITNVLDPSQWVSPI